MSKKADNFARGLPFVFLNAAVTADGKIATANRTIHSFGSDRDLEHLYELRATTDAVMCGARTIEISQATLGNGGERFRQQRLRRGLAEFPLRIIVSGSGSINPAAKIFQTHFSPIILLTTRRAARRKLTQIREHFDEIRISRGREINFSAGLRWLRDQWQVKRLLCEGGGELNDALFRAGLVDEIHLTFCPKIFGGRSSPTIADGAGRLRLSGAAEYKLVSVRQEKAELFTVYSRE